MAKEVPVPAPGIGDILAIHDTGAYTMSMYSRYFVNRSSGVVIQFSRRHWTDSKMFKVQLHSGEPGVRFPEGRQWTDPASVLQAQGDGGRMPCFLGKLSPHRC